MQRVSTKNQVLNFFTDSVFERNTVNFWLQKMNPLWSTHQMFGRICKKETVADDTVTLTLECNKRMQFGISGQHHPVIVEIAGRRYERTYSLTQTDDRHVQLTLKQVPEGIVSTWLCQNAQINDVIEFGMPYGDMLLDTPNLNNVVLLAAGSGITPMYSMLYALERKGMLGKLNIQLMYWVKHHQAVAFKNILEQWAKKYPKFKLQIFCTQAKENSATRLNESYVNAIENLEEQTVFACGPSGFVNTAAQLFQDAKVFKSEAFSLTPVENTEEGTVKLTLTRSNKIVEVQKGQGLLDALEQAQIKPIYGCRMGICNKCTCNKVSGVTKNLTNSSENAEPNNAVRICVNSAKSDLVLDL